jgi:hypothetical protein
VLVVVVVFTVAVAVVVCTRPFRMCSGFVQDLFRICSGSSRLIVVGVAVIVVVV